MRGDRTGAAAPWLILNGLGRYLVGWAVVDGCSRVAWSMQPSPACCHSSREMAESVVAAFRSEVFGAGDEEAPINQLSVVQWTG